MSDISLRPNILIVDDVVTNIKVLAEILKPENEVCFASNGQQALKIAGSDNRPDLILLDIMMPEMDGYEVCRRLKAEAATRNIPIIFITAKSHEEDEAKGLSLGAVDYITKPFCPAIVKARVRTQLERIHAEYERIQREKLLGIMEMAGAICHELNQPMQIISGCSELLMMDMSKENPLYKELSKIKDQIMKMGNITNKLMKITRYETTDYLKGRIIDINKASDDA